MFEGTGKPLSDAGLAQATDDLSIDLPSLWAVIRVETSGCGFFQNRKPKILFERHIFHRRTQGRFAAAAPDLSDPGAGGYAGGIAEYDRLARAVALDRQAALESVSWGLGQVMGFNADSAGFADVEDLVKAMCESEDLQLRAMAGFIAHEGLSGFLENKDWRSFARRYNGPAFEKNDYDGKLREAHAQFANRGTPDLRVRAAQLYLTYLGHDPRGVDGSFGTNSRTALKKFQQAEGVPATGELDDETFRRLEQKAMPQ